MIKNIRNSGFTKAIGLLAFSSFMLASCAKEQLPTPSTVATDATQNALTGEALFKGIFLMEGDVALKLHSMDPFRVAMNKNAQNDPQYLQKRQKGNTLIVESVRALAPAYFEELRQAVASKNFSQVEAAVRKGGLLIKASTLNAQQTYKASKNSQAMVTASLDLTKYDFNKEADVARFIGDAQKNANDNPESQMQAEVGLVYVYANVVAVVDAAVAVSIVAVIDAFWIGANHTDGQSNLGKEQLIKEIALDLN